MRCQVNSAASDGHVTPARRLDHSNMLLTCLYSISSGRRRVPGLSEVPRKTRALQVLIDCSSAEG